MQDKGVDRVLEWGDHPRAAWKSQMNTRMHAIASGQGMRRVREPKHEDRASDTTWPCGIIKG